MGGFWVDAAAGAVEPLVPVVIGLSLFVLAPDLQRLLNVLVLNRTASPSTRPPLARTRWLRLTLIGLQLAWGAYLFGDGLHGSVQAWYSRGGGAPLPPLYGIWIVEEMTLDGTLLPPLLTEKDRHPRPKILPPGRPRRGEPPIDGTTRPRQ